MDNLSATRETRAFFDALAEDWERDPRNSPDSEDLERVAHLLPVGQGDIVLDAGCGTGRLIPVLRRAMGPGGTIVEADVAGNMLKIGKRVRGGPGVRSVQADLQSLPLRAGFFDAVVCFNAFPHIGDKGAVLAEFRRVLKPGRALVIAHLMGRDELNAMHSGFSGPVRHDRLPDERTMNELLAAAGFRDTAVRDEPGLYLSGGRA